MDAVIFCFAFIGFGGRERTLAAQPAIGRPARAEGIEAPFLSLYPHSQMGVGCEGGAERRRLGCIERLDQNRGPHHELSGMGGEMCRVIDALVAAGRGHIRRGDIGAKAANDRGQHGGTNLLQRQIGRFLISGDDRIPSGLVAA